MTIPKGILLSH